MSIEFHYQLTGTGWSKCTLIVDDSHVTVTASYLSDALRSFVAAVCRILDGTPDSTATFDEEPGEYRWRFFRIDDDTIRIQILEFEDLWSDKPDSNGKSISDIQCRLLTFGGAVYDGCKRLLAEHGRDGYKEKWHEHSFPDVDLAELERLLDAERTRRTKR